MATLFKNEKPQCCLFPSLTCFILPFSTHYLLTCCASYLFVLFTAALQLEYKLLEGRDFSLLCSLIYPWPHNNAWHIVGVSEILAECMGRKQVFSASFSNLPLGLRGKAGRGARVTAGPKRPHLSVCPSGAFLAPTETPLCVKLHSQHWGTVILVLSVGC